MPAAANTRRSAKAQAERSLQTDPVASESSSKDNMAPRAKRSRGFEPEPSVPSESVQDKISDIQAAHAVSHTVEDMRDIITCKICFRLLYVPFTAQCGHTFCYSCLCSWLTDHGIRKTCPDCRSPITTQPAPSYIVREMTQRIIAHPELLPEGETVEKHQLQSQEEARMLERHKADADPQTGGMFKGIFNKSLRLASQMRGGIRDESDNVTRCPECLWQLEEGVCVHCGWGDEDYVDYEDDESLGTSDDSEEENPDDTHMHGTDYSEDDDESTAPEDVDLVLQRALRESRRLAGIPSSPGGSNGYSSGGDYRSVSGRSYDSFESYDSVEDEDMDSFIDDGPVDEGEEQEHSDYESTNEGNATPRQSGSSEPNSNRQSASDQRSQPQSAGASQPSQAGRRRGMPIIIDSDSEPEQPTRPPPSSSTIDVDQSTQGTATSSSSEEEERRRRTSRRRTGRSTRR